MKNLVLSGGGVNGIIHLGVLKLLDEHKLLDNISNYCGSSVGSVIIFQLCLGYTYNDIMYLLTKIKTSLYIDENIFSFFEEYGLCNLNKLQIYLQSLLEIKYKTKKITYIELYNLTKKTLNIMAICINKNEEILFNHINTPNIDVIDSIIASSSIPFVFPPKKIESDYYIDAFYVNDFPINIFKNDLKNTIGIEFNDSNYNIEYDSNYNIEYDINNFQDYIFKLFICTKKIIEKIKKKHNAKIHFIIKSFNPLNFDMNLQEKINLFNYGYNEANIIINNYKKKHVLKILKKNKYSHKYYIRFWYKLFLQLL